VTLTFDLFAKFYSVRLWVWLCKQVNQCLFHPSSSGVVALRRKLLPIDRRRDYLKHSGPAVTV